MRARTYVLQTYTAAVQHRRRPQFGGLYAAAAADGSLIIILFDIIFDIIGFL